MEAPQGRRSEYVARINRVMDYIEHDSGYQFDDRLALEIYRNDPETHPEKKCVVDICIPVKPR